MRFNANEQLLNGVSEFMPPDIEVTVGALQLVRSFDMLGFADALATPDTRQAAFTSLSLTDYGRLVLWGNAVTRSSSRSDRLKEAAYAGRIYTDTIEAHAKPIEELAPGDITYCAPNPRDAALLQAEAFTVAKLMPDLESAATLLRLSNYLIHRSFEGNTRTSATIYSLLTRGFDGSPQDKAHYLTILQGNRGLKALGMDIETDFLNKTFAEDRAEQRFEDLGYDEPIAGVLPFAIWPLRDTRPELHPDEALRMLLYFAEDHMNVPMLMEFMNGLGCEPPDMLVSQDGKQFVDVPLLFSSLRPYDLELAREIQDEMKRSFVRSIIQCFLGDESLYGPRQALVERLRPKPIERAAGQAGSSGV